MIPLAKRNDCDKSQDGGRPRVWIGGGDRKGAEGLPANWSCLLSWWSQECEDFVKSH